MMDKYENMDALEARTLRAFLAVLCKARGVPSYAENMFTAFGIELIGFLSQQHPLVNRELMNAAFDMLPALHQKQYMELALNQHDERET